jgi:hypothetical protein
VEKEKKKLRRRCDFCGKVGTVGAGVFWTLDPYDQDVRGIECWRWLHEGCAHEIARDI